MKNLKLSQMPDCILFRIPGTYAIIFIYLYEIFDHKHIHSNNSYSFVFVNNDNADSIIKTMHKIIESIFETVALNLYILLRISTKPRTSSGIQMPLHQTSYSLKKKPINKRTTRPKTSASSRHSE